jgi:hypothetical protein
MSKTAYGPWRYMLIPQKRFEFALAVGKKSLAEMFAAIVETKPQTELAAS